VADRSAIFIDAGYLLDHSALTGALAKWVEGHNGGMQSLRTYWYDGAPNAVPTAEHERIGGLPYVKVRLGRIHSGQQKGVDALIYRDLMILARERAISRAYLLSGDEDLREGVVAAQDMGVQVILIGIPTSQRANQSAALVREADEHVVLDRAYWSNFFSHRTNASTAIIVATPESARAAGRAFAAAWVQASEPEALRDLLDNSPRIPKMLDVAMLNEIERELGSLRKNENLKHEARAGFWAAIEEAAQRPSS
jgi:hypothetical protein